MKINSTVLYTENGQDYVATVLEIRKLEHHSGKSGEPLLHLGFFKQVMIKDFSGQLVRKSVIGTQAQNDLVQFRLDVAHESHEFGSAANKVGLKGVYPGGRWKFAEEVSPATRDEADSLVAQKPELTSGETEDEELEVEEPDGIGQGSEAMKAEKASKIN